VLCTDKTGTLTQDKVVLIRHVDLHGSDSRRVLEHAYLNSLFQTGLKNLLDRAVIDCTEALGLRELAKQWWKIDEIPFDFVRRRMSVVLTRSKRERVLYCKGAVEEMLEVCTEVEDDGRITGLSEQLREQLKALRDWLNEDGLRVIAVGYKKLRPDAPPATPADERDLIFSGFIAFLDPAKETTAEALRLLCENGVAVKILTGDNAIIARKICRDVGLDVQHIATGAEVDSLDAAALREADVGISVDTAVDVAKEAADIILLEKSLLVLERGMLEGRRTCGNVIKYIKMAASSNFGNVFSVLVASAFLPFLQSTGAPAVLATTAAVMAVGVWLPFSPLASAIKLQPLPSAYFIYLLLVLLAYCLLTQAMKAAYIRRFKTWL
jgi:Mg2+-importing ATPase